MRIITRPIERWPGELRNYREFSPFRSTWSQTQTLLKHEAEALGAAEIVIQLALSESDIRIDGWPYAKARTAHPGVIVSLEGDQGPLSFPCDAFEARYYSEQNWHANVRAVALAMEALRKVDRYGITTHGEQYVGWRAIEAGDGPTSKDAAASLLIRFGGGGDDVNPADLIHDPDDRSHWYRLAAKATHPDQRGDPDDFRAVQLALEVLSA